MARGWLGWENAGNGLWYNLHVNFTGALGAVLLVLCLAGLVWALWRTHRPRPAARSLRGGLHPVHQHLEGARRPLPAAGAPAAGPARRAPLPGRRPGAPDVAARHRAGRRGAAGRRAAVGAARRLARLRRHALRRRHAGARDGLDRGEPAGRQHHRRPRPAARSCTASATASTTRRRARTRRRRSASSACACLRPACRTGPRPGLGARARRRLRRRELPGVRPRAGRGRVLPVRGAASTRSWTSRRRWSKTFSPGPGERGPTIKVYKL